MRQTKKQLGLETLECREVFSGMPGVEGFGILLENASPVSVISPRDAASGHAFQVDRVQFLSADRVDQILASPDVYVSQVTDQEIIDALNNGTQVTISGGTVTGNVQRFDASAIDAVFAEAGDSTGAAARSTQLENGTVAGFASRQAGSSFRPNGIPTFDGPQFDDILA